MNKRNWKSRLSKKELKHLKEDAGVTTMPQLKRTLEEHARMRTKSEIEPCWICRQIGEKLGLDLVTVQQGGPAAQGEKIPAPADDPDYHRHAAGAVGDYRPLAERMLDALLKGCYCMLVDDETETGLTFMRGTYYFFPKGLLSAKEIEAWEDEEQHCLSSARDMDRKEAIDFVQAWAKERGIKVTKAAIGEAFKTNVVG